MSTTGIITIRANVSRLGRFRASSQSVLRRAALSLRSEALSILVALSAMEQHRALAGEHDKLARFARRFFLGHGARDDAAHPADHARRVDRRALALVDLK